MSARWENVDARPHWWRAVLGDGYVAYVLCEVLDRAHYTALVQVVRGDGSTTWCVGAAATLGEAQALALAEAARKAALRGGL